MSSTLPWRASLHVATSPLVDLPFIQRSTRRTLRRQRVARRGRYVQTCTATAERFADATLQAVNAAHEFRVCVRPVEEDLKDKVFVWIRFKCVATGILATARVGLPADPGCRNVTRRSLLP